MVVVNESNYSYVNDNLMNEIIQNINDSISEYFKVLDNLLCDVEVGDRLTPILKTISISFEVMLEDIMVEFDQEKKQILNKFVEEIKQADDFYK